MTDQENANVINPKTRLADASTRLLVQFDQNCSPYTGGEVAAFPVEECDKLINRGIAHYVRKDDEGNWIPGDKTNADVESNAEHESKRKAAAEGSEEDSEEGEGEEGEGAGYGEGTKARTSRRKRSKL